MSSECPNFLDTGPQSIFSGKFRHLLKIALAASALTMAACDDDETETPAPVGSGCVSVLDQHDQPMICTFDYELAPEGKTDAANECTDQGNLFLYEAPGQYKINAECGKLGKLVGHVDVDIDEGNNELYESRLIDSLCTDNQEFVADITHRTVTLNDHLGLSTATRCANWFEHNQLERIEVKDIRLDCDKTEVAAGEICDPVDGRDYLIPQAEPGTYANGEPTHLTFKANPDFVPPGKEATVNVTLRQMDGAQQELDVPIIIRGTETAGQ